MKRSIATLFSLCLAAFAGLATALAHGDSNPSDPSSPTLFVAGDSTAAGYGKEDQQGWGGELAAFFDEEKVAIDNRARGGRSSRTFITEGLWDALLAEVKPGDVVLIQFGHNDGGKINDEQRARGSLPGLGDETEAIFNLQTQREETVYTFGHYLRQMVEDVRAKDASPVLLSLTVRNRWEDSRIERGSGQYGAWTYQIAWEMDTPFIDVTNTVADKLEELGQEATARLYPKDHAHFNPEGARLHARYVVAGLKGLRPDLVSDWLSAKGASVKADDRAWLRLPFPADRSLPSVFLIGDSTVRNGGGDGSNGQWGWGAFLGEHLDLSRANVVNRAVGGLSSRTFLTYGHWDRALSMMQPGDFVIMQFGHNDAAALNDRHRARGTIRGFGPEQVEIVNLLTGKEETVRSYGWYLRRFIGDARARGITPIVCSPVPRKRWDEQGRIARSEDSYPHWARFVAQQSGTAFIDLHEEVAQEYEELGPEQVDPLFGDAHTHTSEAGARLNARIVAERLRVVGPEGLVELLAEE